MVDCADVADVAGAQPQVESNSRFDTLGRMGDKRRPVLRDWEVPPSRAPLEAPDGIPA